MISSPGVQALHNGLRGFCPEQVVKARFQAARLGSRAMQSTGDCVAVDWVAWVADMGKLLELAFGNPNWSLSSATHVNTCLRHGI